MFLYESLFYVLPLTISSSERTPLDVSVNFANALGIFPVFISLLNCCASVSVFLLFPFNKRICSAFPSLYCPSRFPYCPCLSRLAIAYDKDPSFSDFVLHSNVPVGHVWKFDLEGHENT